MNKYKKIKEWMSETNSSSGLVSGGNQGKGGPQNAGGVCKWTYRTLGDYDPYHTTSCGNDITLHQGCEWVETDYKFCPFCGNKIVGKHFVCG